MLPWQRWIFFLNECHDDQTPIFVLGSDSINLVVGTSIEAMNRNPKQPASKCWRRPSWQADTARHTCTGCSVKIWGKFSGCLQGFTRKSGFKNLCFRVKKSRMAARFEPPVISDNPTGWGPSTIPAQFKDMVRVDTVESLTNFGRFYTTTPFVQPYQPFSKSDRLGKVSDWTGATYQDRRWFSSSLFTWGKVLMKCITLSVVLNGSIWWC